MALAYQYLTQQDGATEIVGRGIRVYTILGWKQLGEMPEHIADEYGLPIAAVYEALAYATSHAEEMERIRQADEEAQAWALSQVPEKVRHGPPRRLPDAKGSGPSAPSGGPLHFLAQRTWSGRAER